MNSKYYSILFPIVLGSALIAAIGMPVSARHSPAEQQIVALTPGDRITLTCETELAGTVTGKEATITCAPPPPTATPTVAPAAIVGLTGVQDGASVSGRVAIEAHVGGDRIERVVFQLNGPKPMLHTERIQPYYFLGDSEGRPNGWDTTQAPDGEYRLTVTAFDASGAIGSAGVAFRLANGAPATATLVPSSATALPAPSPTAAPTSAPAPTAAPTVPPDTSAGSTFYVSKGGNSADGRSWATAWSELDRIDWSVVRPGDTVLIDGGADRMVYTSSLLVGAGGVGGTPITVRLASESGRNGQAVIFGGRSAPLPYCGQRDYAYQTQGVRTIGVKIDNVSQVVLDGTKWRGIVVHGHNGYGVHVTGRSSNITVRNLEVYDNGTAFSDGGAWNLDHPGINFSGTSNTFERVLVHDNGQDAFQSSGGVSDFTLRSSWLYNGRKHPSSNNSFNHCTHSDGVQLFGGGVQSGLLVEDSVIGPGFMQGLLLGDSGYPDSRPWAVVNDVTIRNSLFFKSTNANISGHTNPLKPKNWRIEHVTSYREEGARWHNVYLEGTGHQIVDSIFQGSTLSFPDGQAVTRDNCQYQTTGLTVGATVDPQFVDIASDDFGLMLGSPCGGRGATIRSPADLVGRPEAPPTEPPAPPVPTPLAPGELTFEAEAGAVTAPFEVVEGAIVHGVESDDPLGGGRASYRFVVAEPGHYVVSARLDAPDEGANSVFINIDGEPASPATIWDIPPTRGFEERIASWRGGGTFDANEFVPAVFDLAAGEHELIVRGRERGLRIDRITIMPER